MRRLIAILGVGMFTQARDQIWATAGTSTAFQALLAPFNDLRAFGDLPRSLKARRDLAAVSGLLPESHRSSTDLAAFGSRVAIG